MAGTRFSKTQALKLEKAKKQDEEKYKYVEGARLPWQGILLVVLGMILAVGGMYVLVNELPTNLPYPDMRLWVGGLVCTLAGLFLIFFSFGKWAKL